MLLVYATSMIYFELLKESPDLIFITVVLLCIPATRLLGVILILFLLYFHRTPDQKNAIGCDQNKITEFCTAPCYGTVKKVNEKPNTVQVFLGLTDIHLQYLPYTGTIKSRTENCCGYMPANTDLADNNTNLTTVMTTDYGDIMIKQISGVLARKIINFHKPGDTVKRGDQLGFIRFGSRVDITFPPGTKILVKPEEKLYGPNTIIAHLVR